MGRAGKAPPSPTPHGVAHPSAKCAAQQQRQHAGTASRPRSVDNQPLVAPPFGKTQPSPHGHQPSGAASPAGRCYATIPAAPRPQFGQIAGDTDNNPENQRIAPPVRATCPGLCFASIDTESHSPAESSTQQQSAIAATPACPSMPADDGETDIGVEAECALDAGVQNDAWQGRLASVAR